MVTRVFLLLMLSAVLWAGPAVAGCGVQYSGANVFTVCSFDPAREKIALFDLKPDGVPIASFAALEELVAARGQKLIFAMNAGMFGFDLKPVGLYVENGVQAKKLNRRNGSGNFHLKPNGVFYVAGQQAGVIESDAYAKSGFAPDYATQSGPMLVIDGAIHPKISPSGTSEKIRNGVGVRRDGIVVFAISETLVTFHEFASFFRDALSCPNALFLDGSVSSLFSKELVRDDGLVPLGPMVAVVE